MNNQAIAKSKEIEAKLIDVQYTLELLRNDLIESLVRYQKFLENQVEKYEKAQKPSLRDFGGKYER